ncbi:hypothetical protein GOFOIKOB_2995 [Methylobacterium tardum]|uniref:HicB family protein n=1 Tax=Methylobacterium tardum TaxID=374432 RepID=A0AA37TB36_9HYPH|nr:type II toxin-antitoxin system HicB family antitoxin [Methylobacterium tardum]URD38341.1 type II toxin-antitoxin system HicB family antitoxin [Methylobacterium tardum]GJE49954.1 hypothetical protein GOFOIKOB_2995 [Methylobacterium tardum]GLS70161.1 HicB family protein [Methylobacterium tardum]
MTNVVMFIHEENGSYGASFPDFPGATTVAGDLDTLYRKAAEMLVFHVGGMAEDGDDIASPRTLDQLRADPAFQEDSEGALIGLVRVDLPGRSVRVNISMEESLLKRVDRAAEASGESRSGFLAQAAKARLSTHSGTTPPAE